MSELLEVGGLKFEVRRSARRKTLSLTVDRSSELVIHAPEAVKTSELADWARSKLLWVHQKLVLKEAIQPKMSEPEFVPGENFFFLGRPHLLTIVCEQAEPLQFDGQRFYLQKSARQDAADCFRHWYVKSGTGLIDQRVALLSPRIGARPSRVEVRDLGFRWGSCGKNAVIYFNWRVLQFPVRLVDYVIAHELAHLLEPHHGPAFWGVLDRSLPDWRVRQDDLALQAQVIHWCHPSMIC